MSALNPHRLGQNLLADGVVGIGLYTVDVAQSLSVMAAGLLGSRYNLQAQSHLGKIILKVYSAGQNGTIKTEALDDDP
jgi:hypothetical protein